MADRTIKENCYFCNLPDTEFSGLYEQWLCEKCREKLSDCCMEYAYAVHDPD